MSSILHLPVSQQSISVKILTIYLRKALVFIVSIMGRFLLLAFLCVLAITFSNTGIVGSLSSSDVAPENRPFNTYNYYSAFCYKFSKIILLFIDINNITLHYQIYRNSYFTQLVADNREYNAIKILMSVI